MARSNLTLVGFMATGKSTVGALCADRLGYAFRDTDAIITERAGRTIPELFAAEGEEGFRVRERAVIAELAKGDRQVIATGGGAVLDAENGRAIGRAGSVAGLRASVESILERVGDTGTRPLLSAASGPAAGIACLLERRERAYTRWSDRQFDTDDVEPAEIAASIVSWYAAELAAPTRVAVDLGARSYPIFIEEGAIGSGAGARRILDLVDAERFCIVTHPGLQARYAAPLAAAMRGFGAVATVVTVPAGERYKSLKTAARLYGNFVEAGLDRKGVIVVVGGGVLGDTAGFAAATYLRGIRVVQAPTTLLAQVDSSVGGKTGVDLAEGKNLIGAFHQPSMVLIDPLTLGTLAPRELRSGLAEVIKYGIIYDAAFLTQVTQSLPELLRRKLSPLRHAITRSCQIKAEVVAQDETEQGLRAILNYGHTVGHTLESITEYRRYKHGEAISIGMVTAALVGEALGVTPPDVTRTIARTLTAAGLPVDFPSDIDTAAVLAVARRDKKTESGRLRMVLAREIGDVYVHDDVPPAAITEAIERQCRGGR